MLIHFAFLTLIFFLGFIYRINRDKLNDKKSKRILFLIYILLFLFIGLRNINIGTDTSTYVAMFFNRDYSFSNIEIIVPLIAKLVHIFTNKYFVYLTILSAISIYGIYYNSKKYKFDTEYFLLLYITSFCYLYSTSAVRFFCAFSIILIAFNYMIKKEDFKVIIMIIIASMFHTSALIFLPAYYFTKIKFSNINIILMSFLLIILILVNFIFGFDFMFSIGVFSKYAYIMDNQNSIGGLSVLMNVGVLLFSLVYYKSINIYKKEYEFFVKMQLFSVALDFISIAHRIVWFFRFPVWFILPIILINLKEKNKRDYNSFLKRFKGFG